MEASLLSESIRPQLRRLSRRSPHRSVLWHLRSILPLQTLSPLQMIPVLRIDLITLQIQSLQNSAYRPALNVVISRPLVVFVHGICSDPSTWNSFAIDPQGTSIFNKAYVSYATSVALTASDPTYSPDILSRVNGSALGFSYNAPTTFVQLRQLIKDFRRHFSLAAVQADVVAHSMGGDVARTIALQSGFQSNDTFGAGPIHKLIIIGTPHLGTPFATAGLQNANSCTRDLLASNDNVALTTALVNGMTVNGAVADLSGNGTGAQRSAALASFSSSQPFPTARVAGLMTATNLAGLACSRLVSWSPVCNRATYIQHKCPNDPLAQRLTLRETLKK
jgi:pimeloyl-ACP methyl ester carboxylesterase